VARIREKIITYRVSVGNSEKRDHPEDQGLDRKPILKLISKK
jgi:hypothetical protein